MKIKYFNIIIVFVILNTSKGLAQSLLDSLYLKLAEVKNDTARVDLLNEITGEYFIVDPKKAFEFNTLALNLSIESGYLTGTARAYNCLGTIHRYRGDNLLALNNYIKSKDLYEQLKDSINLPHLYNFIGQIYEFNADYNKSMSYFNKALEFFKYLDNYTGQAIMCNNVGILYEKIGNDSLALFNYKQAYEMNKKIGRQIGMGFASMNIGNIYLNKKKYLLAQNYYTQSLGHMIKGNNEKGLMQANYNLGNVYNYLENFDSSFYYLSKSKQLADEYDLLELKPMIILSISEMYSLQGNCKAEKNCLLEYIAIQDSLLKTQLNSKILELEQKFDFEREIKEQEYELEQKSRKLKISSLQKYILGIILISVFIIGWVLMTRKAIKIKYINEKLKSKDNELVNLAMYILQKNDLIHEFRQQLLKLHKKLTIEENKKTVDEIINSLIFKIAISKDIEKFRDKLRVISEDFYSKLDQKYPGLTDKEKQMATLLRLDLSSKQIGVILNNTTESIETSRYRLRKKIGLSADENLSDFFNQI